MRRLGCAHAVTDGQQSPASTKQYDPKVGLSLVEAPPGYRLSTSFERGVGSSLEEGQIDTNQCAIGVSTQRLCTLEVLTCFCG